MKDGSLCLERARGAERQTGGRPRSRSLDVCLEPSHPGPVVVSVFAVLARTSRSPHFGRGSLWFLEVAATGARWVVAGAGVGVSGGFGEDGEHSGGAGGRDSSGEALQLNRWFISRLQDLQPALPISPADMRAGQLSRDQMFPLSHHRWMAWRHRGREREGNKAVRQIPSLGTHPPPRGSAAWSVCPLKF